MSRLRSLVQKMNRERAKKGFKFIFKFLITALAIWIIIRKVNLNELYGYLTEVNLLYLILSLVILALSKLLESLRLNIFFRAKNLFLTEIQNLKLYMLGMFYNLFLPGGIGGDAYKIYWLKKNQGTKLNHIIWATLLNRVSGLFGLVVLILIAVIFISFDFNYKNYLFTLIPVLYLIYYFILKYFFKDFLKTLPKSTFLSVFIQFFQLLSAHFILLSLGLSDHFYDYWFLFLISGILFAIPVTLGGFGSRELVFVYLSGYLMVDVNLAVAMGLLTYILRAVISFTGVYFIAFPNKLKYVNGSS